MVQRRVVDRDGYSAVQLGFGAQRPQRVSKAYRAHCERSGKGVFGVLTEFRADAAEELEVGREVTAAEVFQSGDHVDVSGVTRGRGYAGVIRRHGFSGFPASHGTHEYFRHGGSIGTRLTPGHVMKNKRMPGHMGAEQVTVQNMTIVRLDEERGLVFIRGGVPGPNGGYVVVRKAVKAG